MIRSYSLTNIQSELTGNARSLSYMYCISEALVDSAEAIPRDYTLSIKNMTMTASHWSLRSIQNCLLTSWLPRPSLRRIHRSQIIIGNIIQLQHTYSFQPNRVWSCNDPKRPNFQLPGSFHCSITRTHQNFRNSRVRCRTYLLPILSIPFEALWLLR